MATASLLAISAAAAASRWPSPKALRRFEFYDPENSYRDYPRASPSAA